MSALSSSGKYNPRLLFPEWFDDVKTEPAATSDQPTDDSNTDFDYSGVKWELPSDGDRDAMAQLASVMSSSGNVAVSDDSDDEAVPFFDFTPDDREWV